MCFMKRDTRTNFSVLKYPDILPENNSKICETKK